MEDRPTGGRAETPGYKAGDGPDRVPELDALERRIDELEGVADSLGDVPDGRLVETLEEAVGLLEEINAGIEARLTAVGQEADETGDLLDAVDFGPFDEALEELEVRERSAGEPGV